MRVSKPRLLFRVAAFIRPQPLDCARPIRDGLGDAPFFRLRRLGAARRIQVAKQRLLDDSADARSARSCA